MLKEIMGSGAEATNVPVLPLTYIHSCIGMYIVLLNNNEFHLHWDLL